VAPDFLNISIFEIEDHNYCINILGLWPWNIRQCLYSGNRFFSTVPFFPHFFFIFHVFPRSSGHKEQKTVSHALSTSLCLPTKYHPDSDLYWQTSLKSLIESTHSPAFFRLFKLKAIKATNWGLIKALVQYGRHQVTRSLGWCFYGFICKFDWNTWKFRQLQVLFNY